MPKMIPECPPEPTRKARALTEKSYHIDLVTPLFGGGVEAGEADPAMPIRGTSIRGQLQFWWRATQGAACESPDALRARHREVWGATEQASPVAVEVADIQASEPTPCAEHRWDPQASRGRGGWRIRWSEPFAGSANPLPYFLFPFQGVLPAGNNAQARSEEGPASCIGRASFTLRLRFPAAVAADVEAAVWAWVNFGGLGARTRRGCGSLRCRELAPADAGQVSAWFAQSCARYLTDTGERAWPVLPPRVLVRPDAGEVIGVWSWLAGLLRHFRQGERFARNPGQQPNRPGRSRYPEPETIREATRSNRGMSGHQRLPQIPADAFPRAEFGMPIVFHFQGRGEPPDTTLQPAGAERMASPIILKPLALADGRAVPLILPLLAPGASAVELLAGKRQIGSWDADALHDPRLASYPNSPLSGLSPRGSALEAFANFARRPQGQDGPGFEEIIV